MARKKGRGAGPGAGPQPQKPGAGAAAGGGWAPLRDSIRRDVEQAISALAFAERLHQKMDTQRRAFLDFPRIMEQLRSGAVERLTASLSRLYEGGQGFDLQRFLRDLPLALGQLAAADKTKSQPPPPAVQPALPGVQPAPPGVQPAPPGVQPQTPSPVPEPVPTPAPEPAPVPEPEPAPAAPVSPRLELRSKLLAAAPNLAKAAQSYRRNVATLRRAALPRRSPGPWRADREVLEEARRAVEFAQKLYDAYADGWADQPLTKDLGDQTAAELDRFLAWTQLDRYVELAVLASTNVPRPSKPGQHVISAAKEVVPQPPVTEASPGAVVADSEPGPAGEPEEEPASLEQPVLEPELGRD
ncbi:MAG: hypothetical protein E6J65_14660 [Deltaproteobacteria bacterium]|nr:MAG: hypothetical protein E6J65_14660 [Deltaproteobacteria bacterium]